METSLIKWVKTFEFASCIESLSDLSDGIVLHRFFISSYRTFPSMSMPFYFVIVVCSLLCDIAPDHFHEGSLTSDTSNNSILKVYYGQYVYVFHMHHAMMHERRKLHINDFIDQLMIQVLVRFSFQVEQLKGVWKFCGILGMNHVYLSMKVVSRNS